MRIAIATSVLAHVLFVLAGIIMFSSLAGFPTPPEAIAVDLVGPKEFAEALKGEPGKPAHAAQQPADDAAPQQLSERTEPHSPPEPMAMPHWWPQNWVPPNAAAPPANNPTVLSRDEVVALHAHVQKCWSQPAGIPAGQKLSVTMRVSLAPDGGLLAEPALLQASASPHGPAVVGAALAALNRCQPFAVLPVQKYQQWKVLDLTFTPQGLTSG